MTKQPGTPFISFREAPEVRFPSHVDCNCPSFWDGDTFYLFTSSNQGPRRMSGIDQFHLGEPEECFFDNEIEGWRWIEAIWRMEDGTLYGWYHHEFYVCPGTYLTAPEIGAVKSTDNGLHWTDLGAIITARPGTIDCGSKNHFFAGGNGDCSVMLDGNEDYLYLVFTSYAGEIAGQGLTFARMAWKDRDDPVGKVYKYCDGKWEEPGLGGRPTTIFKPNVNWMERDVDGFWGPAIHWNTHLKRYVILLNRAVGAPKWPQEGVYATYSHDLADPTSWTEPVKIHNGGKWYPVLIDTDIKSRGTDKLCGKIARLYLRGISNHEIEFLLGIT
ncbi:MAG: hypothetical protein Q7N50_16310 [Armatimonadota bacterium]|nr:hypothetical protein [Armatimonadota bacterium]